MRALPSSGLRALFAALFLVGALCCAGSGSAQTTLTFTGQVYSPLGPPVTGSTAVHGDPIPNILVFVQDPNTPLPVFTQGVTVPSAGQDGCSVQQNLVPASVLGYNLTDYSGTFTFNAAPSQWPINVVIQAGKWRRQYQYTQAQIASYTNGTVVTLPTMSMPASKSQGDLPQIAVVTGSADAIECIFPQIGIATSEITDPSPTGNGSINLFSGNASSGEIVSTSSPTETQLVNPSASGAIPISNYDMVIFGCQSYNSGMADSDVPLYAKNVEAYANEGGRVFGTHGELSWIVNPTDWSGIVTYYGGSNIASSQTGQLSKKYIGEPTLAAWMAYISALDVSVPNLEFTLTNVFNNLLTVNSPGQVWVTLPNANGVPDQFSFDTPVNTTGTPTAAVNFTNTQSQYDLGDKGDSVVIAVTNTSGTSTTSGLTLTLQIPAGISPTSVVDTTSGGAWTCTLATPTTTCVLPAPLAGGASDQVTLTFDIPTTSTPGNATLIATLTNGGINKSSQCGRVLYNDYHVESGITSKALFNNGSRCSTGSALTSAQKFLEYSLYNLSNFVAPTTSDVLVIQAPSITKITTNGVEGVTTPMYYGQIIGDVNGVNAVVSTSAPAGTGNGTLTVNVDGTLACTLQNDGTSSTCPNAGFTGQNAGAHTVQAFFSGDTVYQPSSSNLYNVTILPDSTSTAVATDGSPSVFNNPVTFSATVTNTAPFTDVARPYPTGTVTFYDNGVSLGTGTLNAVGVATLTTTSLTVGTHTITASYGTTTNFTASASAGITQVVTLPISATSTTLTSTANPAYQGLNITFTATVAQLPFTVTVPGGLSNPAPTGTVSFYDGTTLLGTSPLSASLVATLSTSTLSVATHSITAVYSGDTANSASTSAALSEVIQPNTFTMTVNPTALNLTIGQLATVTVTVTDNGNFSEPVTLSCSGTNAETLCSFASSSIPPGGGTTTLSVLPYAPHACSTTASVAHPGSRGGWPLMAGAGVLLLTLRRRRKLLGLVSFGLLLAAMPMLNGCSSSGCTDFGILPGTYTFTVTATSAAPYAQTQTQTMTMVVKP